MLLTKLCYSVTIPLPKTVNPDDPKIVLIRAGAFDGDFCDFPDILKVFTMIADLQLRDDDQMVISGQTAIIDLGNSSSGHFFNFNVSFLKKAAILNQQGSPLRQKEFHFINTPKGFDIVISLFRSLMTEKNRGKTVSTKGRVLKHVARLVDASRVGDNSYRRTSLSIAVQDCKITCRWHCFKK